LKTATQNTSAKHKITVLLADDHLIVRQGLRSMLENDAGFSVVGEASNGRSALKSAAELKPEVVVMDIGMPDLNGVEATRKLLAQQPAMKVVALSMHADRRFVTAMLEAGATGYVVKEDAFGELATAIQNVMSNRVFISPRIAGRVVNELIGQKGGESATAFGRLSPRQREVLQLIAEGGTTKEIAHKLTISIKTVESHRRQIMEALNLFSVAELTKYAVREGLSELGS
jgi:DNA-binding NarL/FixJ family response regulator